MVRMHAHLICICIAIISNAVHPFLWTPALSFWLYPFERYNGIMQLFVGNWVMPEMQMMKSFTAYQRASSCFEHTGIPTESFDDINANIGMEKFSTSHTTLL